MKPYKFLIFSLFLGLGLGACVVSPSGLSTPLAPALALPTQTPSQTPIPTMAATRVPGQYPNVTSRVLGPVPCSGNVTGAKPAIIRSLAEWNAWVGNPACSSPSGALDLSTFDFSAESVLILQYMDCGVTVSNFIMIWEVCQLSGYLYAPCDISVSGSGGAELGCVSYAVAIPATAQGVAWTICEQSPSYHCSAPVTP